VRKVGQVSVLNVMLNSKEKLESQRGKKNNRNAADLSRLKGFSCCCKLSTANVFHSCNN
jgi:hypothetical protein